MNGPCCPACGCGPLEHLLQVRAVPIMTTVLWQTHAEATSALRGTLDLVVCNRCGLITNADFDPALTEYTGRYENSQHFSPTFSRYAEDLTRQLIDRYGLLGGHVVDIGCGKGELLALFSAGGVAGAHGFDPSYTGEVDDGAPGVRIVREAFGPWVTDLPADLVVCRHVLEHIDEPLPFLRQIVAAVPPATPVYFEVPNGSFVLSPTGVWDLIYPHVSYFTEPSLGALFARAGVDVRSVRSVFGGQFLALEGVVAEPTAPAPDPVAVTGVLEAARALAGSYSRQVQGWKDVLAGAAPGSSVLWGAGAKGVGFLNAVDDEGASIEVVVDVNPRKHGSFVPGTGQEVVPPAALRGADIERVFVMNPLYQSEISEQLAALDCSAELCCV